QLLSQALEKEDYDDALQHLAEGLAAIAGQLAPADAGRRCTDAACRLTLALEKEPKKARNAAQVAIALDACRRLSQGLAAVAGQLERADRTRVCMHAAQLQVNALDHDVNHDAEASLSLLLQFGSNDDDGRAFRILARRLVAALDPNANM